jgi:hypothetical protein
MTAILDWIDALPPWVVIIALALFMALLAAVTLRKPKQNPSHDKSPAPVGAGSGAEANTH